MNKNITFILLFVSSFNIMANPINKCQLEFLGLTKISSKSQFERLKKLEKLELKRNKLRKLKHNPEVIEIDEHHYRLFKNLDRQLYEGKISLARDKWKKLFRRIEKEYHEILAKQKLLVEIRQRSSQEVSSILEELAIRHADSPFKSEIIKSWRSMRLTNFDALEGAVLGQIKKSSRYIGWKSSNYEFINKQLNFIENSGKCKKHCQQQLSLLRSQLGVGARDELIKFPMFERLPNVTVRRMNDLVDTLPTARETKLYKEIYYELVKVLQEKVTIPKWRTAISDALFKISPEWKWLYRLNDWSFVRSINVANHYFPISKVINRPKDVADKLAKLKNQNSYFDEDALLETFSRRADDLAIQVWNDILELAKIKDILFYNRMIEASRLGALKGSKLPVEYSTPQYRFTIYLLAGGSGIAYLYYNFGESEEDITSSMDDLGEVTISQDDAIIELKSEQEANAVVNTMETLTDVLLEDTK